MLRGKTRSSHKVLEEHEAIGVLLHDRHIVRAVGQGPRGDWNGAALIVVTGCVVRRNLLDECAVDDDRHLCAVLSGNEVDRDGCT